MLVPMFVSRSQGKYALESKPQSQVCQLPKANSYRFTLAGKPLSFQWKLEWTQKVRGWKKDVTYLGLIPIRRQDVSGHPSSYQLRSTLKLYW